MQDLDSGVVGRFWCAGRPRTKGSLKPLVTRNGRGQLKVVLQEEVQESKTWKEAMIQVIRRQNGIIVARRAGKVVRTDGGQPFAGAVTLDAFYRLERERSTAVRRGDAEVWPSHDTPWPTPKDIGDEDKFRRNLNDALEQSGLILNDRLVVGGQNYKRWCREMAGMTERPGVLFLVRVAPDPEDIARLEDSIMSQSRSEL